MLNPMPCALPPQSTYLQLAKGRSVMEKVRKQIWFESAKSAPRTHDTCLGSGFRLKAFDSMSLDRVWSTNEEERGANSAFWLENC